MLRVALITSSLLLTTAAPVLPLAAAGSGAATAQVGSRQCEQTPARSARRGIFGAIGRAVANSVLGSNSVTRTISSILPAQQMLTDALINLLDCGEQQKAAKATEDVTTQAEARGAGATVAWRSESRPGVSGRSTVTSVDAAGNGAGGGDRRCMTVTDIVIIDGEETSMPKRMCRQPPSRRYAKV